jgi:hypothetical protein
MSKIWKVWDYFWFSPQNLLGLALMRITLCGTMFYLYFIRMFNLHYYNDASWIPKSLALDVMPEFYKPMFLWCFWPDSMNFLVHLLLIIFLGLLTLGIGGRWLMWLTWIINAGFIQRNYAVNFGADIIAALFLFYMSFTQSCERLSFWNFLTRKNVQIKKSDVLSSLMIRMMQVQICVIYAYTGWEKLKGGSWWDGTALWSILANPQMTTMDYSFLRGIPWIIPILAYLTILFEIYFPVLVSWNKTRYSVLILGFLFHSGIAIFMGLWPFAAVMVSTYFLFIEADILEKKVVSIWDKIKN